MAPDIEGKIAAARGQIERSRTLVDVLRGDLARIREATDRHAAHEGVPVVRSLAARRIALSIDAILRSIRDLEIMIAALEMELVKSDMLLRPLDAS
ncbi:hypothetical protein [Salinarimonas ramus]|uniref:Uncharacterized protein n=1 Tax=Salinarimonas ramus TaxID=690164 RepID=A0A917QG34_9HYPH|nr:hypothetical protein [Salinarimonas ramus]GGK47377.1 hypothetical protein GCM10011322_38090 [Salinarimonas ramus]